MADEDVNGDYDEVQHEKSQKRTAKYDSGAADLEKVTDYAEEKEITSSDGFSNVSTFFARSWLSLPNSSALYQSNCGIFHTYYEFLSLIVVVRVHITEIN